LLADIQTAAAARGVEGGQDGPVALLYARWVRDGGRLARMVEPIPRTELSAREGRQKASVRLVTGDLTWELPSPQCG